MASTPVKSRTPARKGTPGTPNRDTLVKVTFSVRHDQEVPNTDMYVTGSLPMLGSWDARRARKLARAEDGTWNLAVYIPDRVEFMYQYLLVVANEDAAAQPEVVWQGQLERKCRVEEAASTPKGKQLLLDDNTAGDSAVEGTPSARQMIKFDPLMPELNKETLEQRLEVKQVEIDQLLEERERAQCELQKLKDIVGAVENPDDYRKRQSYLPDLSSPLYDTVRELQAKVQRKMQRMQECAVISEELGDGEPQSADDVKVALSEAESKCTDLRERLQEAEDRQREMQAAHEVEKAELRDYYQNAMGRLDHNQQLEAQDRIKEEERKTMLQSSVRVVAGQLDDIKTSYSSLKLLMLQMREAFVPATRALSKQGMEVEGEASEAMEEEQVKEKEGFTHAAVAIAGSVEAVSGRLQGELESVAGKLKKEVTERKRLHNLVQELRGNIRVFCRVRPLSSKNIAEGAKSAVNFPSESDITLDVNGKISNFQFDRVFDTSSTQEEVFSETQPLVVSVLDGYNVCIFAYGQTGSGKTHTMQGYGDEAGVNTRALEQLFLLSKERQGVYTYKIKVSLLEIYNETIRDLLDPKDSQTGDDKKLDVKIAPEGGTTVPGMACVEVERMQDVLDLLATGERNRSVGCTNMNEHSSRSHMILSVYSCGTNVVTGTKGYGKLHLIDLAGSERVGKSGATGDRLKEAQNINKSLSALGDCVQSLVSKSKHVPFRNSKLTYLLQDSLGGESKALMLVCSSPCASDASETVCSLNFASRVRNVELGPAKRKGGGDVVAEMKLKDKEREIEALREEKAKAESAAAKIESKFKDLQCQLHDAQQAAAGAVRQERAATADAVVEHESDVVAAKDAEIASLRALLAAGGGAGAKDEDALSTGGERGSKIPRVASARAAPAASSGRKRAPPISAGGLGNDSFEGMESPLKKRASGNKENRASNNASQNASDKDNIQSTPARTGRTPGKSRATPSSNSTAATGTLDERLAQLRQQRQRDAAAAIANKSVAFAGDEPAASINVARTRPMTAPARAAGSRLASGAARVTAKTAKGSGTGTNSQKRSARHR